MGSHTAWRKLSDVQMDTLPRFFFIWHYLVHLHIYSVEWCTLFSHFRPHMHIKELVQRQVPLWGSIHFSICNFILGKSAFLTIQLLSKFGFRCQSPKLGILGHPIIKTIQIWPLGCFDELEWLLIFTHTSDLGASCGHTFITVSYIILYWCAKNNKIKAK